MSGGLAQFRANGVFRRDSKDTLKMNFYSNWRSLAAYRVRVALALKGIAHDVTQVDMLGDAHLLPEFRAINPQAVLPALVLDDGRVLFQSMAIVEYLDEIAPAPPLLPADPAGRARVRGLALIHAADSHPLLVPRVRRHLQKDAALDDAAIQRWVTRALASGLQAIETNLASSPDTGMYCHGDQVTLADICLSSHLLAMMFFKVDASAYPVSVAIHERLQALPAFAASHPLKQPGAPG
jgi:maleylacetoacetate isomerase/maleylpyruvate isomerase